MSDCKTCSGDGFVVENRGCCGGCEVCGYIEEEVVRCPDCSLPEDPSDE